MHKPQAVNALLCIISSFYKVGEKISQKMWADNFENLKKKDKHIMYLFALYMAELSLMTHVTTKQSPTTVHVCTILNSIKRLINNLNYCIYM